tara:strand:- start:12680 stop:13096 length:417 start_codon:yes stop_codon:yes gene_type:complete
LKIEFINARYIYFFVFLLTLYVNNICIFVEISYKTKKLEKQLTSPRELGRSYGKLARKINQRLNDLKSAETLSIMRLLPAAHCHELSGINKGELAVNISPNYRLIFEPNHDPFPEKEDGGLDWESVTKIQINRIEDYH